jgi:hypothetical protein
MKPIVKKINDGSTLIEWISKEWRFGIVIEADKTESSWHLVTKDDKIDGCGTLSEEFLNLLNYERLK